MGVFDALSRVRGIQGDRKKEREERWAKYAKPGSSGYTGYGGDIPGVESIVSGAPLVNQPLREMFMNLFANMFQGGAQGAGFSPDMFSKIVRPGRAAAEAGQMRPIGQEGTVRPVGDEPNVKPFQGAEAGPCGTLPPNTMGVERGIGATVGLRDEGGGPGLGDVVSAVPVVGDIANALLSLGGLFGGGDEAIPQPVASGSAPRSQDLFSDPYSNSNLSQFMQMMAMAGSPEILQSLGTMNPEGADIVPTQAGPAGAVGEEEETKRNVAGTLGRGMGFSNESAANKLMGQPGSNMEQRLNALRAMLGGAASNVPVTGGEGVDALIQALSTGEGESKVWEAVTSVAELMRQMFTTPEGVTGGTEPGPLGTMGFMRDRFDGGGLPGGPMVPDGSQSLGIPSVGDQGMGEQGVSTLPAMNVAPAQDMGQTGGVPGTPEMLAGQPSPGGGLPGGPMPVAPADPTMGGGGLPGGPMTPGTMGDVGAGQSPMGDFAQFFSLPTYEGPLTTQSTPLQQQALGAAGEFLKSNPYQDTQAMQGTLNEMLTTGGRFDLSPEYQAIEDMNRRRMEEERAGMNEMFGGMGARFGGDIARGQAELSSRFLQQEALQKAQIARDSYQQAAGRRMAALPMGGQMGAQDISNMMNIFGMGEANRQVGETGIDRAMAEWARTQGAYMPMMLQMALAGFEGDTIIPSAQ